MDYVAAEDEGDGRIGDLGLIPGDSTQPSLGFRRAYRDEAQVPQVEGYRCGGGDFHQLADLVVAQGDGRVVQLGGDADRRAFDDGVGQGCSYGYEYPSKVAPGVTRARKNAV